MRPHLAMRSAASTLVLLVVAVAALAACGSVAAPQQVTDRSRLVRDLANRLAHSGQITYTAEYQMPGNTTATLAQAQKPARAAYTYPGGKIVLTELVTADCRTSGGGTTCTLTPPPTPGTDLSETLINALGNLKTTTPTMVVSLLTAAALDPDAVIGQHDTTIAGENASCAEVKGLANSPAPSYTACVTSDGLLGSFTGQVDGRQTDITLERYDTTVAADAFNLPPGAKTIDGTRSSS